MQGMLWTIAALSLPLAALAGWAERRRARRAALDRVGWVPWNGLSVAALFVGVGAVTLALTR